MNTALEYTTRVVQEGGRQCKKSTLNDLVHLTPLRIPLMNPPTDTKGEGNPRLCDGCYRNKVSMHRKMLFPAVFLF
jgi:hypothetical protein